MKNVLLILLVVLLGGSLFAASTIENKTYLPMVSYSNPATKTPRPTVTSTKLPPTPTATKPPISTPISEYPYNWLNPGSAVNLGDETRIGGAKPSMCHKVFTQKSGKTIYLWVEYFGWSRSECETAMNNDYSHVPESHFPLPVCLPLTSPFFPPPNYPCVCEVFNQDYYCEAFGIDYPSNSQEVCAITNGCISVR